MATRVSAPSGCGSAAALGAASLSLHSYLGGFAIGLAFQVSAAVGAVVATAVLAHDFSDGINTVGVVLNRKGGGGRSALGWLIVDAVAPVIGAASTLVLKFHPEVLGCLPCTVRGVFHLYLGQRFVARELSRSPDRRDDGHDYSRHGGGLCGGYPGPGVTPHNMLCTSASAATHS